MSVKSAPYYWVECDGCGTTSTEDGDYSAFADHGTALDCATDSDWRLAERTIVSGNEGHYCPDCIPPWCLECERPITDDNPRLLEVDGNPDSVPDNWFCAGCLTDELARDQDSLSLTGEQVGAVNAPNPADEKLTGGDQ